MKNYNLFQFVKIIFLAPVLFFIGCQDFDEPEFSDYPLDGPIIILTSPNPNGSTIIQSSDPITSISIEFTVEDDIAISNVNVLVDGNEIYNMSNFVDPQLVSVQDLVYDNVGTGMHTFTLTATDSDGNVETVTTEFLKEDVAPYNPQNGEVLYMPFEGDYINLVNSTSATVVGNPTFSNDAFAGVNSYAGATDSYLTYPASGFLGDEFSASFWYKLNASPDRAGILVIGPPDTANPGAPNNRTSGFRFFRENAGGNQRFKLNVGTGSGESWFDGGAAADINPANTEWVHLAFTISQTQAVVYINGQVVSSNTFAGVDWTGCDIMSIMSGAPRFTGWDHKSDLSYMDELRVFDIALTQQQIQQQMALASQTMYLPFDDNYNDVVGGVEVTTVGSPSFTGTSMAYEGNAYAGATDSYLTVATEDMSLGNEFSAAFWYKVNATPDRAGILVIGPPDTANPGAQNNRNSGFRFFRENAGGKQRFKLNVGNGAGENWFDGGAAADIDPAVTTGWVHMAFTISATQATVYINGTIVSQNTFPGISWADCDIMSIMSGAPRFTGWGHNSDLSYMDDLRIFNSALSQAEVTALMN
ncbi:LamG domain-containing protein [Subsaxibacter sp. CAU 1640]|uniref:LamG domain-containing protein n=1 Tax=Subsaxibacter sp. CAU 1640 TaxID=2933271 RepID=UPI0020055F74|nr:LamG domain-containing protein [Subsaxibacter sp. CAU 1640]MCK7590687.1 LamG domain-containing protein [Subsaxibacter sp. CAU 1640]